MRGSTERSWMQSYEVMGGPLADAAVARHAWASLDPVSAPLSKLESSLDDCSRLTRCVSLCRSSAALPGAGDRW